ncbi:MAG: hypothetical protein OXC11_04595 [Rhodospirillales bacterium]|nr:hypothetical protein [Rhodospirillales bacterium]
MPSNELERAFDDEMERICVRANDEVGYKAARFLNMVRAIGGREAVRKLLPNMSDGFTELWRRKRLDLTFEYVMLHPRWHPLFTDEERTVADQRLTDCDYLKRPS